LTVSPQNSKKPSITALADIPDIIVDDIPSPAFDKAKSFDKLTEPEIGKNEPEMVSFVDHDNTKD
jgi:hypothetical protein